MYISNIGTYAFGSGQYRRPQNKIADYPDTASSQNSKMSKGARYLKKERAIGITAATVAAIFAIWQGGYSAGYSAAKNKNASIQFQDLSPYFNPTPVCTEAPISTPEPAPVVNVDFSVDDDTIPTSVSDIANSFQVYEIDLSAKPYLYKAEFGVPSYLIEKGIDEAKLASAQRNVARIFQDGDYIIISPKEDTTMGVIKDVFGIIDGVAGEDSANKLQQRQLIEGSNGNLDDAIIPAGDAIRIERYTTEHGHQIGAYEFHKSNKSRDKIAQTILQYAQ